MTRTMKLPTHWACGNIDSRILLNGTVVVLLNFTTNTQFILQRKKARPVYILRFDEMKLATNGCTYSNVSVTYAADTFSLELEEKMTVRSVYIFMTKKLFHALMSGPDGTLVKNYLAQNSSTINLGSMSPTHKKFASAFFEITDCSGLNNMILLNRALLLSEKILDDLFLLAKKMLPSQKITSDEMERLKRIENLLVSSYPAPPPTIDVLAVEAAMSASKLKQRFRMFYGISVYQYYQRHRMQKANAMVLEGNKPLSQIAKEFRFRNTQTFLKVYSRYFDNAPKNVNHG